MYWPDRFTQEEAAPLWDFVRAHPFGLLLTPGGGDGDQVAYTPLPWIVTEQGLVGHMARANPQWESLRSPTPATLVFCGPNGYISPAWYDDPKTVPTWNYALVEVQGRVCVDSEEGTDWGVRTLIERMEVRTGSGWDIAQSESVWGELRGGIVGLTFEVGQVRGKMKLSQNKQPHERERIAGELEQLGSGELGRLMREVKGEEE